ncbi:MAG: Rne/Rng family ribonuclease [Candidatus Zixiibacteriota bacterium]
MSDQVIINSQVHESRIAILEGKKLVDLSIERPDERRLVGNVYKGKVNKILSSIQAAFIEIGHEKQAFLHINQIATNDLRNFNRKLPGNYFTSRRNNQNDIRRIFSKGDEVILQILKEPLGDKGPKATTEIAIPGRYLVLMPGSHHIGVSRSIRNRGERLRLRKIAGNLKKPKNFGLIVRTIAAGQSEQNIRKDLEHILASFEDAIRKAAAFPPPALIYRDMGMAAALVRDHFSPDTQSLWINDPEEYKRIRQYVDDVAPILKKRVHLYKGKKPIFDHFGVEEQIASLYTSQVRLKSGGYITIDHTEAMVTIDVNSGSFKARGNYEDNILKLNNEAAEEIARQITLRDLGGLIAIDFIDMTQNRNRQSLYNTFRRAMRADKAPSRILNPNEFCIVMLTRKKEQKSVLEKITRECPVCNGSGRVLSANTVVTNIERWFMRAKRQNKATRYILFVHPSVARDLSAEDNQQIKAIEEKYEVDIDVFPEIYLHHTKFIIVDPLLGEDITERYLFDDKNGK